MDINTHRIRIGSLCPKPNRICKYKLVTSTKCKHCISVRLALYLCIMLVSQAILSEDFISKNTTGKFKNKEKKNMLTNFVESCKDGNWVQSCQMDGNWRRHIWKISSKIKKKKKRSENGNTKNALNIMHWNLGSTFWIRKVHHIQQLVDEKSPDLLIISEANLFLQDLGDLQYKIKIDGYDIHLPKSMITMQYSRIILLSKEVLNIQIMEELMDPRVSSIWVKMGGRGVKKLIIGGIYREHTLLKQQDPNNSAAPAEQEARWSLFINQWLRANTMGPCIIIGDTNLDLTKWDTPDQINAKMVELVKDNIETLNYSQMIQGVTRFWRNQAPSAIDQVWTSEPKKKLSTLNITRSVGDHNLIGVKIRIKGRDNSCQKIVKRDRKKFNPPEFRRRISQINWSPMYIMKDINLANNYFEDQVISILDELAPIRASQPRKNPNNWVEDTTKMMIADRDNWRNIAATSNLEAAWSNYRRLRNRCNVQIKKDRENHQKMLHRNMEEAGNIKGIFNLAKKQMGWNRVGSPTAFLLDGRMIRSPKTIANIQVNYFTEKVNSLVSQLPITVQDPLLILKSVMNRWKDKDKFPTLILKPITVSETVKCIRKLSNGTSYGHDKLDAMSVKLAADSLTGPINFLTNMSIETEKFPNRWCITKILPLYKGGGKDRQKPEAYRPISLLPVVAKLVEMAVQDQITKHMEINLLWNRNNHAYRRYHSTTTAMIQLTDLIFEAADRNLVTTIMALDQLAAFDSINHKILSDKLKIYKFGT